MHQEMLIHFYTDDMLQHKDQPEDDNDEQEREDGDDDEDAGDTQEP